MKKFLSTYLSFSKREWRAILLLVFLILILKLFPIVFPKKIDFNESDFVLILDTDSLDSNPANGIADRFSRKKQNQIFAFDPHTISFDSLTLLNLSKHQINTILFYQKKSWRFKNKADFFGRLKIEKEQQAFLQPIIIEKSTFIDLHKKSKIREEISIEINTADSLQWVKLKGIGPSLSSRIIKYRKRLGGFYHVDQLREVYGLADSVLEKIKIYLQVDKSKLHTFKLNLESLEPQFSHPYLSINNKSKILNYLKQHKGSMGRDELYKIVGLDSTTIKRIIPYINE